MLLYRSFSDSQGRTFVAWAQLARNPKTLVFSPSAQGYIAPPTAYIYPASLPAGTAPMPLPDFLVPVIRDAGPGRAGDQCRVAIEVPTPTGDYAGLTIFDASTGELVDTLDTSMTSGMAGKTVNINM